MKNKAQHAKDHDVSKIFQIIYVDTMRVINTIVIPLRAPIRSMNRDSTNMSNGISKYVRTNR